MERLFGQSLAPGLAFDILMAGIAAMSLGAAGLFVPSSEDVPAGAPSRDEVDAIVRRRLARLGHGKTGLAHKD